MRSREQVLGMNTVPPAWIVSISPRMWVKHFSRHDCRSTDRSSDSEEDRLSELTKILDERFGPGSADNVVVRTWVQPMMHPRAMVNKPPELTKLRCGLGEIPNSTGHYPSRFVTDYYKMLMVILVSGKFDTNANCFAVNPHWGTPQWCGEGGAHAQSGFQASSQHMRPINLDNDQLTFRFMDNGLNDSTSTILQAPCAVPPEVRALVMSVGSNFTEVVNERLRNDFPDLGWLDYNRLEKFTAVSAKNVKHLQSQFSACEQ